MKSFRNAVATLAMSAYVGIASAAVDPLITAGVSTAGTAFTDNFGAVAGWFTGIAVTLAAFAMLIKYIKKAR